MNAKRILCLFLFVLATVPVGAQHVTSAGSSLQAGARLASAATQNGFFASFEHLSYNAVTAVDARGGVHLAFYFYERDQSPPDQSAFYTYCDGAAADCSNPANFSWLIQFDSRVSEVQVVATPDGRPRLLIRRLGSRANDYHYWACETECTDAQNWNGLYVAEAAGVELWGAEMPQHSFALDGQGRPRFVYSNGWGVGRPDGLYYAYCDAADCTQVGTWQETTIHTPIEYVTTTADYATLVFDGDRPRVLTRLNRSGLPVGIYYYACDAGCGSSSNWGETEIPYPSDRMWTSWDLALDPDGRPLVALYEPSAIDLYVSGRLFFGWCDGDCTGAGAFELVEVAGGEGKNVDLTLDAQGRAYMVYDAGQRGVLAALWCDDDCTDAGQWQRQVLQTSEQLHDVFAPASPFHCRQDEEEGRAWLDAIPTIAFDNEGRLVVAYDVKNVAICYYQDPTRPNDPPTSRVERIWWAVRVDFFTAPGNEPNTPVEEEHGLPEQVALGANYPNPFNPATTIPFTLREAAHVKLAVYDLLGRTMAVLVDEVRPAGAQQVTWQAAGFPSGVYLCRLEAAGEAQTRSLTLFK